MTPVHQTKFKDAERGIRGNCLQAAVASVLDLPLDEVPHFIEHDDWERVFSDFLHARGLDYECRYVLRDEPPDGYAIGYGTSPRGIKHAVVTYGWRMVHDPHPDGTGLSSLDGWWELVPELKL